MDIIKLMGMRHSVRQYRDKKIETEKREVLDALCKECNAESGLNIQIIYDEPKCFNSMMAHYGKFSGVTNYIAIVGKKDKELDEKSGYYGEKLVLKAQEIGLNTCWVALTHGKSSAKIDKGEKQSVIIALGYGENQGVQHKNKSIEQLSKSSGSVPEWYKKGMRAVLLAPTAVNQQKFTVELKGNEAKITTSRGAYTKMDLGIVKYHFEAASGHKAR